MIFGGLVVILILVALATLIIPVLKKPREDHRTNRTQQNIQIAKEKKNLLEEQLQQQQMTQEEYDAALKDLENSLAIDLERQQALADNRESGTWVVWLFALFVPVISIYLYLQWGAYQVIENPTLAQARTSTNQAQNPHQSGETPSMDELIEKLKAHLRENPEDSRGWFMLGRTMMTLQKFADAVVAFERSYDLNQNEPSVLLALADSLAMTNNGNMSGRPQELVLKALELSPNEVTGLWLAGLAAEQTNQPRAAYDYWTRLLPLLNEDPQSASEVKTLLATLKENNPDLPDIDFNTAENTSASGVSVVVSLAPQLTDRVNPNDMVFIYAKASSGPPMPLAAKRLKVADLPVQVSLSDDDAMMPQMQLSSFDQIIVGARVSKSGNAIAQAGDLFSESDVIEHKSFNGLVEINIEKIKQ